jgi:hypothetical protein
MKVAFWICGRYKSVYLCSDIPSYRLCPADMFFFFGFQATETCNEYHEYTNRKFAAELIACDISSDSEIQKFYFWVKWCRQTEDSQRGRSSNPYILWGSFGVNYILHTFRKDSRLSGMVEIILLIQM